MQKPSELEIISGGSTGLIKLRAERSFVEKALYPDSEDACLCHRDLRREYLAYKRLPLHPRLLYLHPESTPDKLVLPYIRNGCLHEFLRSSPVLPTQRLQFAADAAEGLHVLHCANILHGDINSWNFLVDDDFRLCIIDFAGSTIDGVPGSSFEGVRYCLPRPIDDPSTIKTELFGLASLLYEIMTSKAPYEECKDEETEHFFKLGQFPSTQDLPIAQIILGCWQGSYDSAEHVHKDIQTIARRSQSIEAS